MQNLPKLMDSIHIAYDKYNSGDYLNPDEKGENKTTYCNFFINDVCKFLGYNNFEGCMANQIVDKLWYERDNWETFPMPFSQMYANNGELIIAGQKAEGHGHVCVLIPGEEVASDKWKSNRVPMCANIGKKNFISKGLNYAFKDIPFLFRYKKHVV